MQAASHKYFITLGFDLEINNHLFNLYNMKKAYNFNAGPCVLPKPAIEAAIEALKDFKGTGMSVIEVSHRSKEWEAVMDECRALWKELLNIPDGYSPRATRFLPISTISTLRPTIL